MADAVPALQLHGVHKRFGATSVVRGVELAVTPGERLAIIGPNGAGKTTLFNLISGRDRPSEGAIYLHGHRIDGLRPFEIHRRGLSRSFQIGNFFPHLTVFDNLRCAMLWSQGHRYALWGLLQGMRITNAAVQELLAKLRLDHKSHVLAAQLGYAEQRALEIGITVAGGAQVLLLDEPTAGMSRDETKVFVALIRTLSAGRTLLMVEHDMGVVFELASRVAVLVQGEVLACDTPAAVREDARVQAAYLGLPLQSGEWK